MKKIDVQKIKNPKFLKKISESTLETLAFDIRKLIIDKCSQYGGHLSSNLGLVELELSLYKVFDAPFDKIFFDVGHECYVEKILTGRPLLNLRKKDGNDGFLNMHESKYDVYEAGHSSTSIGTALGYAYARDFSDEKYKIVVVIGDASLANGVAFEAINNLNIYHKQFLIILNDNEMGIASTKGGLEAFFKENEKSFKSFNLDYYGPIDGNNFRELNDYLTKVKNIDHPVLLHIKTKKGKGYSFSELDKTGKYHFINKFDIKTGDPVLKSNLISFSYLYSKLLNKEMEKNKNIVVITPATSMGANLTELFNKYKERTFDVGINEEHALLFANGLALSKKIHPYVVIYSTFLQRAIDEVIHDIARMDTKVTILVDKVGLIGEDGLSHQGIYDLSFLMNIPNLTISAPSNFLEAKELFKFSLTFKKPLIIRYPFSLMENEKDYSINKLTKLKVGYYKKLNISLSKERVLLSYGPHINEISSYIKENKIDITLINLIFIKPISITLIKEIIKYDEIIIYDPYSIKGGLSSYLLLLLNEFNYKGKVKIFSIDLKYVAKATILEQEKDNKVDVNTVYKYLLKGE